MPHNATGTNHATVKVACLKSVLRQSADDLLATADLLQFIEGMAARLPGAVPDASIDALCHAVSALLAKQDELQTTIDTFLSAIASGQRGTDAARALIAFATTLERFRGKLENERETMQ